MVWEKPPHIWQQSVEIVAAVEEERRHKGGEVNFSNTEEKLVTLLKVKLTKMKQAKSQPRAHPWRGKWNLLPNTC